MTLALSLAGALIGCSPITSPYTFTDPLTSANNGTVTYTATASDAAGNTAAASQAVTVNIGGTGSSAISTGTSAEVIAAATAFLATLSTTQQSSMILTRTQANAVKWSNLPCGSSYRNGIMLGSLSTAQKAAALRSVQPSGLR